MKEINDISPLMLAYLGDSVMEVFVRKEMVENCKDNAECNKRALDFVTANAQVLALKSIMNEFTEEEKNVFVRAKNAKSHHVPKNSDVYTYRLATGFEAVFGYNYLMGNNSRNEEIFYKAFNVTKM